MSCKAISNVALANTTPVKPPIVNKRINPKAYNKAGVYFNLPPNNVANQLKILIPGRNGYH